MAPEVGNNIDSNLLSVRFGGTLSRTSNEGMTFTLENGQVVNLGNVTNTFDAAKLIQQAKLKYSKLSLDTTLSKYDEDIKRYNQIITEAERTQKNCMDSINRFYNLYGDNENLWTLAQQKELEGYKTSSIKAKWDGLFAGFDIQDTCAKKLREIFSFRKSNLV